MKSLSPNICITVNVSVKIRNLPNELRRKGLKRELAKLCKKHDIVFMAIFGSYVRGEQSRKSDIDIAIEFKKRSRKSLLDLMEVENELALNDLLTVDAKLAVWRDASYCNRNKFKPA